MYYNFFKYFRFILFLILTFTICFFSDLAVLAQESDLMSIADYSYKKIYNALPKKNRTDTYIYNSSDGVALLALATYDSVDYKTSVKHRKNSSRFLYCVDNNNTIEFTDKYVKEPDLFNNELKTRLGMALYYGPQNWGDKAKEEFTTGNSMLDYYMTQIVVHALIYDYGDAKSNMGIDFGKIAFKEKTGKLKKKTTALYKACCKAKLIYNNGYFQSAQFSFDELDDDNLYLDDGYLISSTVKYKIPKDVAEVSICSRGIRSELLDGVDSGSIFVGGETPFSDFIIKIPIDSIDLDALLPGEEIIHITESIDFRRAFAGLYVCGEADFLDTSQELGGILYSQSSDTDSLNIKLLIGEVYLYKTDSITDESIADAAFDILQYNEKLGEYEPYCTMTYNPVLQRYESPKLVRSINNKNGKFKVIETKAGANYTLDWEGEEFEITNDCYIQEFHFQNQPILGSVSIEKMGEQWSYNEKGFIVESKLPLPQITFALYAKEDIYVKNAIKYIKDQKIVDMITDENGQIKVTDLPIGEYYVVETLTLKDYILDSTKHCFSITRDSTRRYSDVSISVLNHLKSSDIHIFKCYYTEEDVEEKNPIPLKNALFGLYIKDDLCDINGKVIVKKDTCISQQYSNDKGMVVFQNLPYVEYYVKELKAPDGFAINDGIVTFTLDEFEYDTHTGSYLAYKTIINQKQRFSLQINKTGENFIGFQEVVTDSGSYYEYILGSVALPDVSFSLYDNEQQLLATKVTDSAGKVQFDDLEMGTYYISETNAPKQYHFLSDLKEVVLMQDNTNYNIFEPKTFSESYHNQLCDCTLELTKFGEQAIITSNGFEYQNIPLGNIVFGIYQNFDYVFADNQEYLPKGSCVGYITTKFNGVGKFIGKLPCGEYYLKEISTLPGYEIDTSEYFFRIEPNDNNSIQVSLNQDGNPFVNKLSKASVKIRKVDAETGKTLKGVEFTLYNSEDEKIGVYKTNRKGEITVDNLPYGEYYFVETKCKKGYYSSNSKYYFELYSGEQVTLDITNSPIVKLGFDEQYNVALCSTLVVLVVFVVIIISNVLFVYYNIRKCDKDE